jgi:DNA-binding MarR family transcriptional regulator
LLERTTSIGQAAKISRSHIRTLDLTPSQFDIVATLGNTDGMSFKELGEKHGSPNAQGRNAFHQDISGTPEA